MTDFDFPALLTVAVRAWAEPVKKRRQRRRPVQAPAPQHALVLDTETTTDSPQGLLFGAFRYCRIDRTTVTAVAEGLIYADTSRSVTRPDSGTCDGTAPRTRQTWI